MLDEILLYVKNIGNDHIRAIVGRMVNDRAEQLLYYPAALRNPPFHPVGPFIPYADHAEAGRRMLEVYKFLDADLLRAGVIIHDLEKINELNAGAAGVATEYTRDGLLLGHIVQGVVEIDRVGRS